MVSTTTLASAKLDLLETAARLVRLSVAINNLCISLLLSLLLFSFNLFHCK